MTRADEVEILHSKIAAGGILDGKVLLRYATLRLTRVGVAETRSRGTTMCKLLSETSYYGGAVLLLPIVGEPACLSFLFAHFVAGEHSSPLRGTVLLLAIVGDTCGLPFLFAHFLAGEHSSPLLPCFI